MVEVEIFIEAAAAAAAAVAAAAAAAAAAIIVIILPQFARACWGATYASQRAS